MYGINQDAFDFKSRDHSCYIINRGQTLMTLLTC